MLLSVFLFIAAVAPVIAEPTAPWWAPAAERIAIELGKAFIYICIPTGATIIGRIISNHQHVQNLKAVQSAIDDRDVIKTAIEEIHQEVKTGNALKLGQMADAGETRRIGEIAPKHRTEEESAHIEAIPAKKHP